MEPCWSTFLQPYDSVVVIFSSTVERKATHLSWRDSSTVCVSCIPYNNTRNLSNTESYNKTLTKEHKRYLHGYYEYTFTEEDYDFAKE